MSDPQQRSITVAASGTESSAFGGDGYRLVGLILPTLDSTTIGFEVSPDGGSYSAVKTNVHGSAPAAITLGTANTGACAQAVSEEIGRLAATAKMKLVVASQTGGARTITGLFQRV